MFLKVCLHKRDSHWSLAYLTRSTAPSAFYLLRPTPVFFVMPVTPIRRTPSQRRTRKIKKRTRKTKKKLRMKTSKAKLEKVDLDRPEGRLRALTPPLPDPESSISTKTSSLAEPRRPAQHGTRWSRQMSPKTIQRTYSQLQSPLMRLPSEIRSMIWHLCLCLDRVLMIPQEPLSPRGQPLLKGAKRILHYHLDPAESCDYRWLFERHFSRAPRVSNLKPIDLVPLLQTCRQM